MIGNNISKTAEPSVFIFSTDLRVDKGHRILEGVGLPLLSRNEPPARIWQFKYATVRLAILSPATPARLVRYCCKDSIMQFLVYCLLALVSFS